MAKSAQQIIRESVRRILKEGTGDTLSMKLFGTEKARTELYNSTFETWMMNETGYFKFVFTPSPDKSKLTVTVTAESGADARVTSDIESSTDAVIKTLAPADWADITSSWEYKLPAGVKYKKDDDVVIPEAWTRIAGLLK